MKQVEQSNLQQDISKLSRPLTKHSKPPAKELLSAISHPPHPFASPIRIQLLSQVHEFEPAQSFFSDHKQDMILGKGLTHSCRDEFPNRHRLGLWRPWKMKAVWSLVRSSSILSSDQDYHPHPRDDHHHICISTLLSQVQSNHLLFMSMPVP